ncbi:SRPBCC family protein [Tenuibacillus multivorans]|uniref:SRPBCC family protein n=1 Tax=Tenuibacillus multivorans TaxID=237069 RepID=UPI000B88F275|nr:SRPBCC domain-containing protein [Tenuibacillus multivorans]GEL77563.1 hypothetical protein TMU01_17980 [Tenuibacillus multivorans]
MTISHRTYVKRDPEDVYQTLTSADAWNTWFTDETSININEFGTGQIQFVWKDFGVEQTDFKDGGEIIEAIPHKSFIFQWTLVILLQQSAFS